MSSQEHRPPAIIQTQKSSVLQLLSNPPVQITVPEDITSNHEILDLLKKAATMTFEAMKLSFKDQERENFQNGYRKGAGAALLMCTTPLPDEMKTEN